MKEALANIASILKQPFWALLLVGGMILVTLGSLDVRTSPFSITPHGAYWPLVGSGFALLASAVLLFGVRFVSEYVGAGIDLSPVRSGKGGYCVVVERTTIGVVYGRIESFRHWPRSSLVVLPANEYFDDDCLRDPRSSLGAYMAVAFGDGLASARKLIDAALQGVAGREEQKNERERAISYGIGHVVYLCEPEVNDRIALVSVTTQRPPHGLEARVSSVFKAIERLWHVAADRRLDELILPVIGAGHGGLPPPLALVGIVLAIAEMARTPIGRHVRKVTVVVFRDTPTARPEVHPRVIRRALALAASSVRGSPVTTSDPEEHAATKEKHS